MPEYFNESLSYPFIFDHRSSTNTWIIKDRAFHIEVEDELIERVMQKYFQKLFSFFLDLTTGDPIKNPKYVDLMKRYLKGDNIYKYQKDNYGVKT